MNQDFIDLLRELSVAEAKFLIVGAYAVSWHGKPRSTGDLDVFVERTPENAARVWRALERFGAPLQNLTARDLESPDLVYQVGIPPRRVDLLTSLTGVSFEEAWSGRVAGRMGELECPFIGREALVRNKRALGRPRDLMDLENLGEA